MRFGFNSATVLGFLIVSMSLISLASCRESDSSVGDLEHEDLVCPDDQVVCVLEPEDKDAAKSVCADLDSSHEHCGTCGNACNDEARCIEGACEADEPAEECEPELSDCSRDDETRLCVDLSTDFEHCGQCENACNDEARCVEGACEADEPTEECEPGLSDCSHDDETRLCVDLSTDFEHCGACDSGCEPGMQRCYDGECVPLCSKGYSTCGAGCCHWEDFCGDEERAECATVNCLIGSPCGDGCCSEEQDCGPGSICHDRCDEGETVCGESCCTRDQTCTDGRCFIIQ